MVSKRRTRRRRNRQLKGGDTEQNSNLFAPFKTAFDQTRKDLLAKGADMNEKFKKKAADLVTDAANAAHKNLADADVDADEEKKKWCRSNMPALAKKATENAGREVKAAVIHAREEEEELNHDAESLHASSPHTDSIPQYGGRKRRKTKRRKTKRRKTKRRKTKRRTKRRKKRKSRRRRRK